MSRVDWKEIFNPYCDLAAPRARIEKLCEEHPAIASAINEWRKEKMEDPKLLAKYRNPKDFVDFNLSQFLQLTSEFSVREADGADKKIFSRNINFEYFEHKGEWQNSFRGLIEAIEKEAAEAVRSPELQMVVARCTIGTFDDQRKAGRLYKLAADQGYAPAQVNLGFCFQEGIGGEPNKVAARRLYKLAADQGYAPAQCSLGFCFTQGIGGEKNEVAARRLYQLAADQGYAPAQVNLGFYFELGIGGEKDSSLALLYYSRGAAQKSPYAINSLEFLGNHFQLNVTPPFKLNIIPPHTPLVKDQIIEIINNLAPEKVRIFNKASHIIGDLVEASKSKLETADLFEIHECLSRHLTTSKVDPMESKSCKKILECIAERIKSEIGVGLAGEISYSGSDAKLGYVEVINPLHERGLNFRIVSEVEEGLGGVKIVHNPLFGGAAAAIWTLDQRLQEMQKAGKLTYDSESKTITVTKANLETFSTMSVPAADVAGAGAGAVVGGAAVRREGGGSGGGGGGRG
jgi:hypothetical protein